MLFKHLVLKLVFLVLLKYNLIMGTTRPSQRYWIIAALAVLWNLIGLVMYTNQVFMSNKHLAELPAEQAQLITEIPQWVNGVYTVAAITGLLGSVFLIIRRGTAVTLFGISLLAILVQMGYSLFSMDSIEVYGMVQGLIIPVLQLGVSVFLVIFSKRSAQKGYLIPAS